MGRGKRMKGLNRSGQGARLRYLVIQTFFSVGVGIVLLLGFAGFNFVLSNMQSVQLKAALALDQYRTGSKTLTFHIQSYAVTGLEKYHEAYLKELNEDQNQEKAREIL